MSSHHESPVEFALLPASKRQMAYRILSQLIEDGTETALLHGSLLYIDPETPITAKPVIDEATAKLTAAFRTSESNGQYYRGVHTCICGSRSTNTDYNLQNGFTTNSLAIHYVALHRSAVPDSHLAAIHDFDVQGEEPTIDQLAYPLQPTPNIMDEIRDRHQRRVATVLSIMAESGSLVYTARQTGGQGISQWSP